MKPEPDFGADFAKAMKAPPEDPGRSKDVKCLHSRSKDGESAWKTDVYW